MFSGSLKKFVFYKLVFGENFSEVSQEITHNYKKILVFR